MKEIYLSKAEFDQIDAGIQIDFYRFGFSFYAVAGEYGDWVTPNGTRFSVNLYAPTNYDLTIRSRQTGKNQNWEE